MDIYVLFAVSFFVAIAAVLRGITGFGFALIAVPLLALFLSPEDAVCIVVLVQASIAVFDISSLRTVIPITIVFVIRNIDTARRIIIIAIAT